MATFFMIEASQRTRPNPSPLWGGVASEASRGGVLALDESSDAS
jgi:hypothetical protein